MKFAPRFDKKFKRCKDFSSVSISFLKTVSIPTKRPAFLANFIAFVASSNAVSEIFIEFTTLGLVLSSETTILLSPIFLYKLSFFSEIFHPVVRIQNPVLSSTDFCEILGISSLRIIGSPPER